MTRPVSRRSFLSLLGVVAAATTLPPVLRLRALAAWAAVNFSFTPHQRAVLTAAADTVVPPGTVHTRRGTLVSVPGAGATGTAKFIENLVSGGLIYAAGARRPPYVVKDAPVFPAAGTVPLWTVKRFGWFGDPSSRATRLRPWPSELLRLQAQYVAGIAALDAAVPGGDFSTAPAALREVVLRQRQAAEVAAFNGRGEGNQPFFLTFLDHVAQACFGDPGYGGNRDYVYWDMIDFSGPSYINSGGPGPGQGWTAEQLAGPFRRP